jgi:23S rRNA pseudouridine1911/1915/1917 synthase
MKDRTYRVMAAGADDIQNFEVSAREAGRRLDLILAERLDLSRAQARRLLARGAVAVAGRTAAESEKGSTLAQGVSIAVEPFRRAEDQAARPEPAAPLTILAQGPGWLAADKPAGTPVHPLREDEPGTLLGAVLARHPEMQGVGEGGLRSGVVHRLDVETSGVLLLATHEERWQELRSAFREHRVEKVYRAVVAGQMHEGGSLAVGLAVARHRPARVRVVPEHERARARGVRDVEMSWRPLDVRDDSTLVEVRPVTGFLHQIRVVMAYLGHPLLGDRTYARGRVAEAAPRHLLHAASVACGDVAAESPLPPEFVPLPPARA